MITSVALKNFRNFKEKTFDFYDGKNFIIGKNGMGKTNVLEAISLFTNNSITGIAFEQLVHKGEDTFFISCKDDLGNQISLSFSKSEKKKTYLINGKKTTKQKLTKTFTKSVIFSPIIMNLMYLGPSLRRDFLDNILIQSFDEYDGLLGEYKKILFHRNKILKNIREQKSTLQEIDFWDEKFIEKASQIYEYRFKIIDFFDTHIKTTKEYFQGKIDTVEFVYESKCKKENTKESIKKYLEENKQRDIILGSTHIGPHRDDFDISLNKVKLTDFASRGETKSVIIWMKLLEGVYIEKKTNKKPILIIDDLLSELDEEHKSLLVSKMDYYQTFVTSIEGKNDTGNLITL